MTILTAPVECVAAGTLVLDGEVGVVGGDHLIVLVLVVCRQTRDALSQTPLRTWCAQSNVPCPEQSNAAQDMGDVDTERNAFVFAVCLIGSRIMTDSTVINRLSWASRFPNESLCMWNTILHFLE